MAQGGSSRAGEIDDPLKYSVQETDVDSQETKQEVISFDGRATSDENVAARNFLEENYPGYMKKVYRVPSVFIKKDPHVMNPKKSRWFGGKEEQNEVVNTTGQSENKSVQIYGTRVGNVTGDEAEKIVADNFENLLKWWCKEDCGVFIITGYDFTHMVNRVDTSQTGEHDVLIIHEKYGIFTIQIKSCNPIDFGVKKKVEKELAEDRKFIEKNTFVKVSEKMKEQLDNDKEFIEKNFGNLSSNFSITPIAAFPNIDEKDFKVKIDVENVSVLLKSHFSSNQRKESIIKWWEEAKKGCRGFNQEDFEIIVWRYLNTKKRKTDSVVRLINQLSERCTDIILTPFQHDILNCSIKKLVIRGQYGTGKTIVLIQKVEKILQSEENVFVISMAESPLIDYIKINLKANDKLECSTILDQKGLGEKLRSISGSKNFHIFIDEFPTFRTVDDSLKRAIEYLKNCSTFWVICSSENEQCLSNASQMLFEGFEEVYLDQIMRCPLPVQKLFSTSDKPTTLNLKFTQTKMDEGIEEEIKEMRKHIDKLTSLCNMKWSHLSFVDEIHETRKDETRKNLLIKMLNILEVPYVREADVMRFSSTDVDTVLKKKKKKALYIDSLKSIESENFLKRIKIDHTNKDFVDKSIYYRGHKSLPEQPLKKLSDLADLLYYFDFRNEKIEMMRSKKTHKFRIPNVSTNANVGADKGDTENVSTNNWCDLIFVDTIEKKPEFYELLQKLDIPLSTPSCIDDVITRDAAVYVHRDFRGYERWHNITFTRENDTIFIKGDTRHRGDPSAIPPVRVIHSSRKDLNECQDCQKNLRDLIEKYKFEPPDMVIIDCRNLKSSAAKFFENAGVKVDDKIKATSFDKVDDGKVQYIRPVLFKGLERTCVFVLKDKVAARNPIDGDRINDHLQLAFSRCTALLVIIEEDDIVECKLYD